MNIKLTLSIKLIPFQKSDSKLYTYAYGCVQQHLYKITMKYVLLIRLFLWVDIYLCVSVAFVHMKTRRDFISFTETPVTWVLLVVIKAVIKSLSIHSYTRTKCMHVRQTECSRRAFIQNTKVVILNRVVKIAPPAQHHRLQYQHQNVGNDDSGRRQRRKRSEKNTHFMTIKDTVIIYYSIPQPYHTHTHTKRQRERERERERCFSKLQTTIANHTICVKQ